MDLLETPRREPLKDLSKSSLVLLLCFGPYIYTSFKAALKGNQRPLEESLGLQAILLMREVLHDLVDQKPRNYSSMVLSDAGCEREFL